MITDLSAVITGGLVKRQIGQVDLETGELLKGVTVWVKIKRSPYVNEFIMANQEALLTLAQDKEITGECYRVLFVLLTELDYENYTTYPKKKLARSLGYDPKMYIGQSRSCYKKGILLSNERGYRLNHNYGWKGNVRKLELVKNRS